MKYKVNNNILCSRVNMTCDTFTRAKLLHKIDYIVSHSIKLLNTVLVNIKPYIYQEENVSKKINLKNHNAYSFLGRGSRHIPILYLIYSTIYIIILDGMVYYGICYIIVCILHTI